MRLESKHIQTFVAAIVGMGATIAAVILFVETTGDVRRELIQKLLLGVLGVITGLVGSYLAIFITRLRSRPSVFISYSKSDSELANRIAKKLDHINAEVLLDSREMLIGDSIIQRINDLVDRADFIILVVSNNWAISEWAQKELNIVLSSRKRVLPAVVDRDAIPAQLRGLKYADFSADANADLAIDEIVKSIRHRSRHAGRQIDRRNGAADNANKSVDQSSESAET